MKKKKRNKTLKCSLNTKLSKMYKNGKGVSKKLDEEEAFKKRKFIQKEYIKRGYSKKDSWILASKDIPLYKNKIYSENTLKIYKQSINHFCQFVSNEASNSRISISDSKNYIESYIEFLKNENYTTSTINTYVSAVCKSTGANLSDFETPIRHYTDVVRSCGEKANDELNYRLHSDILELNNAIGLRRSELKKLKLDDISYNKNGEMLIKSVGKGKKNNINLITDSKKIEIVEKYIEKAAINEKGYLLPLSAFKNDADLHHERSNAAKDRYNEVVSDMKKNNNREYYKKEIVKIFKLRNRNLNENLDKNYICRGKNAEVLKSRGIAIEYDRVAVLYTSLTVLNHYRSNVTVQHYLVK